MSRQVACRPRGNGALEGSGSLWAWEQGWSVGWSDLEEGSRDRWHVGWRGQALAVCQQLKWSGGEVPGDRTQELRGQSAEQSPQGAQPRLQAGPGWRWRPGRTSRGQEGTGASFPHPDHPRSCDATHLQKDFTQLTCSL